jgi:CubicO group peptidase (beta-lactamase class C family)
MFDINNIRTAYRLYMRPATSFFVCSAILQAPAIAQETSTGLFNFDAALESAQNLPRMRSLLVSQDGEVVLERYFNGANARRGTNVKSVSKSIISTLIGIAIEQGHIPSVKQPIGDYFSAQLSTNEDAPKESITIENLLTMQAGLETTSNRNYGAWIASSDWVDSALQQPLHLPPGRLMEYSTGNTHLLSAILTATTGQSTLEFARKVLAEPLGFYLPPWPQDPQGIYFGGNDMELTPPQMLAFGQLYLNNGQANGTQIIPRAWVENSLIRRAQSRRDRTRYYGYGWWSRDMAGHETSYAWGFGGQFILLVPELNLVVVTTSSSNPGPERRAHTRRIYDLVEHEVIAAVSEQLGYPPVFTQQTRTDYSSSGQY